VEIAKAVTTLDVLLEQIAVAQETARAAITLAKQAEANAKDVDMERAARLTEELRARLDDLAGAIAQRVDGLRELRDKVAAEAPSPPPDPVAAIREKVLATSKMESLSDAQKALKAAERELSSDDVKGTDAAAKLLSIVRYRMGDTLLKQASLETGPVTRENLMNQAADKFNDARKGKDSANTGEGSSLHAVALLRVVQIESALRNAYKERSDRQPEVISNMQAAKAHDEAAKQALGKIERLHSTETLPNGRKVVDEAKAALQRSR